RLLHIDTDTLQMFEIALVGQVGVMFFQGVNMTSVLARRLLWLVRPLRKAPGIREGVRCSLMLFIGFAVQFTAVLDTQRGVAISMGQFVGNGPRVHCLRNGIE